MAVEIGITIRKRREALGLSQAALARQAHVDLRQLAHYEKDEQLPSLTTAVRLADVLGFTLNDLTGDDARAQREAALVAARERFTGTYPPGYLATLRDEWPD